MDIQEQRVDRIFLQRLQRRGTRGGAVNFPDAGILAEQKSDLFYRWKLIIGNHHVNHAKILPFIGII